MKRFLQHITEERINPATFNIGYVFYDLNRTLFDNALPLNLPISFGKVPTGATGITKYQVRQQKQGRRVLSKETLPDSMEIVIAPRKFEEEKLKGIVAHEMIHALLALRNTHESNQHGPMFLATLAKIQRKADFKIPLTDTPEVEEHSDADYKESLLVFIEQNGSVNFCNFMKTFDIPSIEEWLNDRKEKGIIKWALVMFAHTILDVPKQRRLSNLSVWKFNAEKMKDRIRSGPIVSRIGNVPDSFLDLIDASD